MQLVANWKNSIILNQEVNGKVNLVLRMTNKGSWFAFVKDFTMDYRSFCIFILLVQRLFKDPTKRQETRYLPLLDNDPIYKARLTTKVIQGPGLWVNFLSANCPEMLSLRKFSEK